MNLIQNYYDYRVKVMLNVKFGTSPNVAYLLYNNFTIEF